MIRDKMSDSDNSERESKQMTVPKYRGNYNTWCTFFKAWAAVQDYHELLTLSVDLPTKDYFPLGKVDEMDGSPDENKKQVDLLVKNAKIINALHRAFSKHPAMIRKIELTINEATWPVGRAWLVMQRLDEAYKPKSMLNRS